MLESPFYRCPLCDFLYGLNEGVDIEGFGDIIVDIRVDFVELVSLDAFCGQYDDGILFDEPIDRHFLYGFYTVHDRHHKVQKDDSLETFFEFKEAVSSIIRGGDLKAMAFEKCSKAVDYIGVVIDDHKVFLKIPFLVHMNISLDYFSI